MIYWRLLGNVRHTVCVCYSDRDGTIPRDVVGHQEMNQQLSKMMKGMAATERSSKPESRRGNIAVSPGRTWVTVCRAIVVVTTI